MTISCDKYIVVQVTPDACKISALESWERRYACSRKVCDPPWGHARPSTADLADDDGGSPERKARERGSLVCGSLVLPSQRRVQLGPGELLVAVGLAVEVGEVTGVLRR